MGYKTDLSDAEWSQIEDLFSTYKVGRPKKYSNRSIMNAIRYQHHTGCQWDMLPNDLPPVAVVRHFFYEWRDKEVFQKIQKVLHQRWRKLQGRNPDPSLGIIDAQSVKTVQKGGRVATMPGRKSKAENAMLLLT